MIELDGKRVAEHYIVWSVTLAPGSLIECDDEEEARLIATNMGGSLMCQEWYITTWEEVPL